MEPLLKKRNAPQHQSELRSTLKSSFLHPYRKVGIITDQHSCYSALHVSSDKYLLTLSVGPLFHTYDISNFKLINTLPYSKSLEDIKKISHFKDLIILQYSDHFALYKKSKLVGYLVHDKNSMLLDSLVCGTLVIALSENNQIMLWQISTQTKDYEEVNRFNPLEVINIPFEGLHLFHPNTYLNKVLIYDDSHSMILFNIRSHKIIYQFSLLRQYLKKEKLQLSGLIVQSPIVDIVALGTDKPYILLWNLKTDALIMSLKTGYKVTSISFSNDSKGALKEWSLLATGLENGQVVFWDLNSETRFTVVDLRKVLFRESDLFRDNNLSIGMCKFVESGIIVASGGANFIGFFIFESDTLHSPPRLLRSRRGHLTSPHRIRFYEGAIDEGSGSHTKHILSLSTTQLRDNALLNDAQSTDFSFRKAHSKGQKVPHSDFNSFAFSVFRERDWSNVLTSNIHSQYPFLWSAQRHAIATSQIQSKPKSKNQDYSHPTRGDLQVRSITVSACGNFGVAGYESGKIIKFIMQSAALKYEIKCEPVGALVLDAMNKVLINCSSTGSIICRDFYGGKKIWFRDIPIKRENKDREAQPLIHGRLCDHNSLLATADISGRIYIYDLKTYLQSRILRYGSSPLQITDLAFLVPVGRILAASTRDGSLFFWELLSGTILEKVVFDIPVTSIDVSRTGEFLATTHSDSLAVHLWVNKSRFETVQATGAQGIPIALIKPPKLIKRKKKPKQSTNQEEELIIETPQVISDVAKNKWKILMHLAEIKRRNEAKLPKQEMPEMPFFLFDLQAITKQQDVWQEETKDEVPDLFQQFQKPKLFDNRKIEHFIKAGDKDYKLQLTQLLNTQVDVEAVMKLVQDLPPSAIEYEIQHLRYSGETMELNLSREKQELIRKLKLLLNVVEKALSEGFHIDSAQAVLSQLLKFYDEELSECEEELERVSALVEQKGREMRELCGGVECMVDYLIEGSRKK